MNNDDLGDIMWTSDIGKWHMGHNDPLDRIDGNVWTTIDGTRWSNPGTTISVQGKVFSYDEVKVREILTELKEIELLAEEFPQINQALRHLRAIVKLHKADE